MTARHGIKTRTAFGTAFATASAIALLAGTASLIFAPAVDGQESILPPGFGGPEPKQKAEPKQKGEPKAKGPTRTEPKKSSDPKKADEPRPASPSPAAGAGAAPRPVSPVSPAGPAGSSVPFNPTTGAGAAAGAGESTATHEAGAGDEFTRVRKYDLPAGSRRSLERIGPLTQAEGGLPADAFWGAGGNYLSILMDKTNAPLVSRWGSILLRRAMVSSVDTPTTINGADFVASRADLLLRMGEANAARELLQNVDPDKATPKLLHTALDIYMANADPGGLCPLVPRGLQIGKDARWDLARGMCTGLSGDASTAGVMIDRSARKPGLEPIDGRLAEKILGASANGRRSVKIEWEGVKQLTPWRFGLATATAVEIPDNLFKTVGPDYRAWQTLAPMTSLNARVVAAPYAAQIGVLSNNAYVDLVSAAFASDERDEKTTDEAQALRDAYVGATLGERMTAIRLLWANAEKSGDAYAGQVLTARAAARLPVTDEVGDDMGRLIASMLSAGLDTNAAAWARVAEEGSDAWALLAVGAPNPLNGVDAGAVDNFSGNDNSPNYLKSKIFLASLAGLGRIDQKEFASAASDLDMNISGKTAWAAAIEKAANDGQQGTVALLAAVGLQGDNWGKMNPMHLYHITAALRKVGLNAEARMIAAEAVARSG